MDEPLPDPMFVLSQLLGLADRSRSTRLEFSRAELEAVTFGRRTGHSWAELGALLDVPSETLRRNYRHVGGRE